MTTVSYPTRGTGGLDVADWTEHLQAGDGIVNDLTGTACSITRVDASNLAQIGVGQIRVGGYILEITATHDLTVSTSAATYYIWAKYDPAANAPDGGGAGTAAGPCSLGISSGAPSTAGGVIYTLLYQIVRGASQALTAATLKDYRVWVGPTIHIPTATTLPAELQTDPEGPVTGFGPYPVGATLHHGITEYVHVKSTSGLKWEATTTTTTPNQQLFTSSGTWNKPAGAKWVRIRCQAGGGAGGGAPSTSATEMGAGGGGQGGGYAESLMSASSLAASVAVTRGAGGTGVSAGDGNPGATSSFGAHVIAIGGGGGKSEAAVTTVNVVAGGFQTQSNTGQIQIVGQGGGFGLKTGGTDSAGGQGGSSHMGGGAHADVGSHGGDTGGQYGGGGSGASNGPSQSARSGGAGAGGIIIVTTYF